jgi:hypothetical protein
MTRKKNSTFVGSPMADVDVDALTFRRTIANAIGDTARAYDRATGSNSETNTMIHDGAGRGCLLGVPWCNQFIGRSLAIEGTVTGTAKHGGDGPVYLAAAPFFVPIGETRAIVDLRMSARDTGLFSGSLVARVYDTSGSLVDEATFIDQDADVVTADLRELEPGEHLLTIEANTVNRNDSGPFWQDISIHTGRRGRASVARRGSENSVGVTDPGTSPVFHRNFDDSILADGFPVSAFHTSGLNRNQTGLLEYLRGWPAGDNADFVHTDSGSTNPTRSEFAAHARAGFASEPLVPFPLFMQFLGAAKIGGFFVVDAAEPPTVGMRGWYAPWPKTSASLPIDISRQRIMMPDFPTAQTLRVSVLAIGGPIGTPANWGISAGAGGTDATASFAQVGSTNLWRASANISSRTADAAARLDLGITRTAGARSVDEMAVLGWGMAFGF